MAVLILCASDVDLRDAWRLELEARRHDVTMASTAASAFERLREGGFDLLVVDHDVMGGIEILTAGMIQLPEVPPMVLISGAPDGPEMSAHVGAAVFMPKPCNADELGEVVDRVATA